MSAVFSWMALLSIIWIAASFKGKITGPIAAARAATARAAAINARLSERGRDAPDQQRHGLRLRIAEVILGDEITYDPPVSSPSPSPALPREGDTIHTGPTRGSVCMADLRMVSTGVWTTY